MKYDDALFLLLLTVFVIMGAVFWHCFFNIGAKGGFHGNSFLTEDLSCVRRAFTDSRLPSEIQRAAREEILNLRLDLD